MGKDRLGECSGFVEQRYVVGALLSAASASSSWCGRSSNTAVLTVTRCCSREMPGVGTTGQLDAAASLAVGRRVVRAVGAEFEADLSFAALHQILQPPFDAELG
jgi:hypothetical protein